MNILMYHSVSSSADAQLFSGMHGVTVRDFEDQLSFLIKNSTVLGEKDIRSASLSGIYPKDDCFYLTFDDGFKQHFNNVYPILKDYGIQASFFIPTMHLESKKIPTVEKQRLLQYNLFSDYQEFLDVFCTIARYKVNGKARDVFYPNTENINSSQNYLSEFDFYSNKERFFRLLRNENLSAKDFSNIINHMFEKFYSDDGKFINDYYMSASDIKIMSDNGMVIGGHSYSHPFLNKIPIDKMQKEIDRSMSFLRQVTNKNINSFAYPFGAFDDNVVDYLQKIGMDYAFDTRRQGKNHRYNIRRNDGTYFLKE